MSGNVCHYIDGVGGDQQNCIRRMLENVRDDLLEDLRIPPE
jgi:hypothetical protein